MAGQADGESAPQFLIASRAMSQPDAPERPKTIEDVLRAVEGLKDHVDKSIGELRASVDVTRGVMEVAITRLEVQVDGEAARDAKLEMRFQLLAEYELHNREMGKRLTDGWTKLFTARALAWAAPQPARLAALALGAFLGAAMVTWAVHHYGAPLMAIVAQH